MYKTAIEIRIIAAPINRMDMPAVLEFKRVSETCRTIAPQIIKEMMGITNKVEVIIVNRVVYRRKDLSFDKNFHCFLAKKDSRFLMSPLIAFSTKKLEKIVARVKIPISSPK